MEKITDKYHRLVQPGGKQPDQFFDIKEVPKRTFQIGVAALFTGIFISVYDASIGMYVSSFLVACFCFSILMFMLLKYHGDIKDLSMFPSSRWYALYWFLPFAWKACNPKNIFTFSPCSSQFRYSSTLNKRDTGNRSYSFRSSSFHLLHALSSAGMLGQWRILLWRRLPGWPLLTGSRLFAQQLFLLRYTLFLKRNTSTN